MEYRFFAYGHPNILATHKTTLEFTKDENLSLRGNCIVGVKADFKLSKLKNLIKKSHNKKISIIIKTLNKRKIKEEVEAELNLGFNSNKELVIRKTTFISGRTFGIRANKAAFELNKGLINYLKEKENKVSVVVENKEE